MGESPTETDQLCRDPWATFLLAHLRRAPWHIPVLACNTGPALLFSQCHLALLSSLAVHPQGTGLEFT